MTFRTRLLLFNAALLLTLVAGILGGIEWVVRREVLLRLQSDLEDTSAALQGELLANQRRLKAEAHVVGEEPRLKAVVFTHDVDAETLSDVADELKGAIGWDVLGLFGTAAQPLAVLGISARGSPAPPLVAEALSRGDAAGYWSQDGRLFQGVARRLAFGSEVGGALLAGSEVGRARAEELARQTHAAVAFFSGGELVASSLSPAAAAALASRGPAELEGGLSLGDERFVATRFELAPGVAVAVLESAARALGPYDRLRRAVAGVGALALLLAVALAALMARGWSRPIAALAGLAESVKKGDLEARVRPAGGRELEALGTTLNEMVGEISRQRRRDELARFLVHDLKNPLTSVMGFAQVLESTHGLADELQGYARNIASSAQTMLSMVMDLLDVGSESSGALVPRLEVFDMPELVEQVCTEAQGRARRRQLSVLPRYDGPRNIRADRELLRRVLENLIDNAFKYAPQGGAITVFGSGPVDTGVRLEVRDEGPGVPVEFRARIFERYFRLDRDAAQHTRTSRGLGLLFCRLAVEAHRGRIWVEDAVPKGSAFCVELPVSARVAVKSVEG